MKKAAALLLATVSTLVFVGVSDTGPRRRLRRRSPPVVPAPPPTSTTTTRPPATCSRRPPAPTPPSAATPASPSGSAPPPRSASPAPSARTSSISESIVIATVQQQISVSITATYTKATTNSGSLHGPGDLHQRRQPHHRCPQVLRHRLQYARRDLYLEQRHPHQLGELQRPAGRLVLQDRQALRASADRSNHRSE